MATPFMDAAVKEARAVLEEAYKVTGLMAARETELAAARLEMTRAKNTLQFTIDQLNKAQQLQKEASAKFQAAENRLRLARQTYNDGDYEKARDAENEARIALDKLKRGES